MNPQPEDRPDPGLERRRRVRRRRKARLKAAALGRSRGGLTSKIHLPADRRRRPLSLVLTPGQAADSPRFIRVMDKIKVRGPVGRPRTARRPLLSSARSRVSSSEVEGVAQLDPVCWDDDVATDLHDDVAGQQAAGDRDDRHSLGHRECPRFLDGCPSGFKPASRATTSGLLPRPACSCGRAVDSGEVIYDRHGVIGSVVNTVFRMVDAAPVKAAARDRGADLVLVTSDALFRDAKASIDAGGFEEVAVRVKETTSTAWMRVFGGQRDGVAGSVGAGNVVFGDATVIQARTVGLQLPVPFQLPAPTPDFVGRERALADLDAALARVRGGQPVTVMIEGMAGVGKTALALRWAHQVRDRFPDGQM